MSEPVTARGLIAALRPLQGMSTALFVHTVHMPNRGQPWAGVEAIRGLLDRDGLGVVYMIPRGKDRLGIASCCVDQTWLRSPAADILLDAGRYTGSKHRKLAAEGIDQAWVNHQHRDGLAWALTDSGYVGRADLHGLQTILTQAGQAHEGAAARGRGVLAALPLATSWLTEQADVLAHEVGKAATPVALMLEDEMDPLARKNAVTGLVTVLAADVPVAVLRCDTSVLGALAYGAAAVSVGDSSALRHFYPATTEGGPRLPAPLATLVPELLGYYHLTKIDAAISLIPTLSVWRCPCRVCGGRRLDWIANSTHPHVSAFEHAVAALAQTARGLFAGSTTPAGRQHRWWHAVRCAQATHRQIRTGTGQRWEPKPALGRWVSHYAGATSPHRP